MKDGLGVMGSLYASLTGTTVLQQRSIPSKPPSILADDDPMLWNSRPYEERGWCIFEGGVAAVAEAHVSRVMQLERLRRPKLKDISFNGPAVVSQRAHSSGCCASSVDPRDLLIETQTRVNEAHFTGKGDKEDVKKMLSELHEKMDSAVGKVLSGGGAALTESPARQKAARAKGRWAGLRAGVAMTSATPVEVRTGPDTESALAFINAAPSPTARRGSAPAIKGRRLSTVPSSANGRRGSAPPTTLRGGDGQAVSPIFHAGGEAGWAGGSGGGIGDDVAESSGVQLEVLSSAELLTGTKDRHGRKLSAGYI